MKELRDIIDSYLERHYSQIESWRLGTSKTQEKFSWKEVSEGISKEAGIQAILDAEYIRARFRILRKEKSITGTHSNNFVQIVGTKEVAKEVVNDAMSHSYFENKDTGTAQIQFTTDTVPTEQEIIKQFNIDESKFKISRIVYNKKSFTDQFTMTIGLTALKNTVNINWKDSFNDYLKTITPLPKIDMNQIRYDSTKSNACLILPRQDIHFNKYDINGNNDIDQRFREVTIALARVIEKAQVANNLDEVVYIVGSDEFNSEWTGLTTKGTPQQNILSYQEAFKKICDFEVVTLTLLASICPKVKVVFLPGNHDEIAGWHLVNFLESYFRLNTNVTFSSSTDNTKILRYGNSLFCFNHGDDMSPKMLASKFPVWAKEDWSFCEHYYVFSGDKHTELSSDQNGVLCFRVPQLSKSVGKWDDKKGYNIKTARMVTFLVDEQVGLCDILRQPL